MVAEVNNNEDELELVFLRHSEAGQNKSKSKNRAEDFNRRLTTRGVEHCEKIAADFVESEKQFDFVICSPTERTKETLENIKACMGKKFGNPEIVYDARLYSESWEQVFEAIKSIPKWARRVLVIGHDILKKVVMWLSGSKRKVSEMKPGDFQSLHIKKALGWNQIRVGCARIGQSSKILVPEMVR